MPDPLRWEKPNDTSQSARAIAVSGSGREKRPRTTGFSSRTIQSGPTIARNASASSPTVKLWGSFLVILSTRIPSKSRHGHSLRKLPRRSSSRTGVPRCGTGSCPRHWLVAHWWRCGRNHGRGRHQRDSRLSRSRISESSCFKPVALSEQVVQVGFRRFVIERQQLNFGLQRGGVLPGILSLAEFSSRRLERPGVLEKAREANAQQANHPSPNPITRAVFILGLASWLIVTFPVPETP